MPLQFYAVMNISRDTITYYNGTEKAMRLAPYSAITGEVLFYQGRYIESAPYLLINIEKNNGLLIVHRNCETCPKVPPNMLQKLERPFAKNQRNFLYIR